MPSIGICIPAIGSATSGECDSKLAHTSPNFQVSPGLIGKVCVCVVPVLLACLIGENLSMASVLEVVDNGTSSGSSLPITCLLWSDASSCCGMIVADQLQSNQGKHDTFCHQGVTPCTHRCRGHSPILSETDLRVSHVWWRSVSDVQTGHAFSQSSSKYL